MLPFPFCALDFPSVSGYNLVPSKVETLYKIQILQMMADADIFTIIMLRRLDYNT